MPGPKAAFESAGLAEPQTVLVAAALCASLLAPGALRGQACSEAHYRWSEKVDTTLAATPAARTDISHILATWAPPPRIRASWCAPRSGREDSVFVLHGWVRRIQLHEGDGDWHIELTETPSAPPSACIIVEIPAVRYGALYRSARAALAGLVDTTRLGARGAVDPPVEARFSGAAFFDGLHELPRLDGTARPVLHGRCNGSLSALWELHPVYYVAAPGAR